MAPKVVVAAGLTCLLVVAIVACVIGVLTLRTSAEECHSIVGQEALDLFATKRHYHFDEEKASGVSYTPEGCQAEKLWYFGRHGTRYPGDDDIIAMQKILPRLHAEIISAGNVSSLCPSALSFFSTWTPNPNLNVSMESYLTEQGHYELSSISSRFLNRFPHLYSPHFSNSSYHFKFTKSQRTNASARAFVSSIFNNVNTVWFPKAVSNDPILKFYSVCKKWEEQVDDNPAGSKEYDLFVKGPEMNQTISRVSERLGLDRTVTLEELTTMYTTCAFETAWSNGTLSQWCVVFDMDDLAVMEYAEDLEYYWKDGYGFPINWEQACPPFKDALNFFDNSRRTVQGYFSHSGATLKMFARLGLFNGRGGQSMEIRADNFEEMKDHYEWRTSRIDFMGSNMAFVSYRCDNTLSSEKQKNMIGLFTQELPTPFPACGDKAFCSYDEFKSRISEFTDNCDLNEICRV